MKEANHKSHIFCDSIYGQNSQVRRNRKQMPGVSEGWGVTANEYGVSFGGSENILELEHDDGCPTP